MDVDVAVVVVVVLRVLAVRKVKRRNVVLVTDVDTIVFRE